MNISFIKMQGAGNDYIYLDLIKNCCDTDFTALARKISSRHFGVGADGLVVMTESKTADYRMRMFNADGSEAEMCGNAIRCVGKYLFDRKYVEKREFTIDTLAGEKTLWIAGTDSTGRAVQLTVDMGQPVLSGRDIPIAIERNPVIGIDVMGFRGTAVGMGNPHFVIFTHKITDDNVLVNGPQLEKAPVFPNKTNVEFIQVIDKGNIVMRVWERGSGETLACGTGACASAVAGVLNNLTSRKVDVKLPGGTLHIEWSQENNTVYLTGPAEEVFGGTYFYDDSP